MVTQEIHIKRATPEDAELISSMSKVTFEDTFRGTCTDEDLQSFVDTAFSLANTLRNLNDENDFYFIAYINNEAAGYMRLKENYTEYDAIKKYNGLELKRIYVAKEYQSKKVGAALMAYALQFSAEKNYEVLWLGVWEHNEKARSFYKKWGFIDTGDTHDFPIGNTPQTDMGMIKFIAKS